MGRDAQVAALPFLEDSLDQSELRLAGCSCSPQSGEVYSASGAGAPLSGHDRSASSVPALARRAAIRAMSRAASRSCAATRAACIALGMTISEQQTRLVAGGWRRGQM